MPQRDPLWWRGLLSFLDPLLQRCRGLGAPHLDNFVNGVGTDPHPSQPHLFTQCLVPTNFATMLSQFSGRFRFLRRGGGSGGKAGSFKLREYGITLVGGVDLPCQETYVSRLLCYMYRGPPPSHELEACHMCENRMCLAPWHLVWASHKNNLKGYGVHKKNRRLYHPYAQNVRAA